MTIKEELDKMSTEEKLDYACFIGATLDNRIQKVIDYIEKISLEILDNEANTKEEAILKGQFHLTLQTIKGILKDFKED